MELFSLESLLPWLAAIAAFVIGSIPFGMLVGRVFYDKNKRSSRNAIWPAGVMALALEIFKGALPVLLVLPLGARVWTGWLNVPSYEFTSCSIWLVGLFAVIGHCFSPWLHFRGGKGIPTVAGVALVLSPLSALVGAVVFGLIYLSRQSVSLSGIGAILAAAVTHVVFSEIGAHYWPAAAIVLLILIRHELPLSDFLLENE